MYTQTLDGVAYYSFAITYIPWLYLDYQNTKQYICMSWNKTYSPLMFHPNESEAETSQVLQLLSDGSHQ